jgi:phosphoenolpyruvate-protein phosphotransferase
LCSRRKSSIHYGSLIGSISCRGPRIERRLKGKIVANLLLVAPMKGWVAPLDEVPDPVFAERILGDGLAIDPTDSTVHAPCDGVIASSAKHAVTLRATNGAEILIHVGLETVALGGQGFVGHVRDGRSVKTGDPLLTFDLDYLATHAKSLVSPIVVTNGNDFAIVRRNLNRETGLGEFLMELKPLRESIGEPSASKGEAASREIVVSLAHGIHARPAAVLANCTKRFGAEISFVLNGRRVNARSVVALMSLGVRNGDRVTVAAEGVDAAKAVAAIAELIASGLGETPAPANILYPQRSRAVAVNEEDLSGADRILRGVCAAPGMVIGKVAHFHVPEIAVVEQGAGIAHEIAELDRAVGVIRARLEAFSRSGDRQRREILGAHLALLEDPEILQAARASIRGGKSAAFAWRKSVRGFADAVCTLDDPLLKERAQDLLDLERQVITELMGQTPAPPTFPDGAILVSDELLPSQLVALGAAKVGGFCTAGGGPTSHVAILAAGMNVPALVGMGLGVLRVVEGTDAILDAGEGTLTLRPGEEVRIAAQARLESRQRRTAAAQARSHEDCRTLDGTRIEVFANLGADAAEAAAAVESGAEGCGLLRTEFLFLDRATPPSEDEQREQYQAIASALDGRPFIIRTFDIGGDKPVPYLPFPPEENPALGLRGVRAGLWRPDILRTQLSAILKVKPAGQCRIMLPMIASLSELKAVRAILSALGRELGIDSRIPLGVMVETPASALLADKLAVEADFLSIGTNDLTQYTLAMDRGHPQLAAQIDALHPAVLRLIARAAEGGHAQGKQVGVCGGLAADPLAAPLLIGLGIDELSMPTSAIPGMKAVVRALSLDDCRKAAQAALDAATAEEVRVIASNYALKNGNGH